MVAKLSGRRSLAGLAVLVASILAAACSGPPPAHHAAHDAAHDAARQARPGASTAVAGDPGWRITHPGHLYQLAGFADHTDVLPGGSFRLFVSTTAASFTVRAFRMGWY